MWLSMVVAGHLIGRLRSAACAVVLAATLLGSLALPAVFATPAQAQNVTILWEPTATLFWTVNEVALEAAFQNGQCTQWAAQRRPDIVEQIFEWAIRQDLALNKPEYLPNMDALNWLGLAVQAGVPTGHRPRAGALIVFQPGVLGAASAGHIAYVQRVFRNGRFRISEMHAPLLWHVSYRTLPASAARLSGVGFIY